MDDSGLEMRVRLECPMEGRDFHKVRARTNDVENLDLTRRTLKYAHTRLIPLIHRLKIR